MMPQIENKVAWYWIDGDGGVCCKIKEGVDQTQELALDSLRVFRELCAGTPRPTIIDIGHVRALSREARACYTGPEASQVFSAMAIVYAGSTVARSIANFTLTVMKPDFPVRLFANMDEAKEWIYPHLRIDS
jgi:hypothetical protein